MSLPRFEVDSKGLAKLIERRGKSWAVAELLQNAFDAPGVSQVTVSLVPAGRALAELTVEDDSPNGSTDLGHCYTFFAESEKKSDPTLRDRFNMGEKLALASTRPRLHQRRERSSFSRMERDGRRGAAASAAPSSAAPFE